MSVRVGLDELAGAVDRFGPAAYVLTTGPDGRPHVTHAPVRAAGGGAAGEPVLLATVGARSLDNARRRPLVTVLWPAIDADGFSLIVDAGVHLVQAGESELRLVPTGAVLHRPAPAP